MLNCLIKGRYENINYLLCVYFHLILDLIIILIYTRDTKLT